MGSPYAKFQLDIGDKITTFDRNLMIIDRKYIDKILYKNNREYNLHRKYYKYKCLNCGNEDWIIESVLTTSQHCGCNVCCSPPKKIVNGINDIATTNPWMVKYFVNQEDATKYSKFSTAKVDMICPDCNRIHKNKTINDVYRNGSLTCPCHDGWSYPNKFMYSLLEQIGVHFETEKIFDWSNRRRYDNYIEYNGLKIITEQHGQQHYFKKFNKNARSVEEEIENDKYKYELAIQNGIDKYFIIDSSFSNLEYMKNSIINCGILNVLNVDEYKIDWLKCNEFATSNIVKNICTYKENNPNIPLREVASLFHVAYGTAVNYIKNGSKLGWCSYESYDDLRMLHEQGRTITNQRPIHCISDGKYYRGSKLFVEEYEKQFGKQLCERNIRSVCSGKRNHVNNLKFEYITQEEFNNIKSKNPELAIGEFFKLKEVA